MSHAIAGASVFSPAVHVDRAKSRRHSVLLVAGPLALLSMLLALPIVLFAYQRAMAVESPAVAPLDTLESFVDTTSLQFTIRGGIAPWRATESDLRSDGRLWLRMQLSDWDRVRGPVRGDALGAMVDRYRSLLVTPARWDAMGAADWDGVPQPVRTLAYRQMIAYWAGFYQLGAEYGLDAAVVRDTLAAIVMQESWFEHRAISISRDGNRDLGLAQASDFARARMAEWALDGRIETRLHDDDYFDPWKATRFLAIWMKQVLVEASGDLDVAIRAYHRGSSRAHDARGTAYLELVRQRRSRFMANRDAPPAWSTIWCLGRELQHHSWPWLSGRGHNSSHTAGSQRPVVPACGSMNAVAE